MIKCQRCRRYGKGGFVWTPFVITGGWVWRCSHKGACWRRWLEYKRRVQLANEMR